MQKSRNLLALLSLKILKPILAYLFLATILFTTTPYTVFTALIKLQKGEFRERAISLGSSKSRQIIFSAADLFKDTKKLEWRESNKEILLEGRYYEVVSIQKHGDVYIANITEDLWENDLFELFFNELMENDDLNDFVEMLVQDYELPAEQGLNTPFTGAIKHFTQYIEKEMPSLFFRIIKPPCGN